MTKRSRTVLLSMAGGIIGLLAVLALIVGGSNALADVLAPESGAPARISYQGYLSDADGEPISGTVNLQFGLYTEASGGSPIWTETQTGVPVDGGYFAVLLGSVTPLDAGDFDDPTRYLGVSVDAGGGYVDLPRQQLASVPYALQAEQAASASTAVTATTASTANQAPWDGLTGVPAGFADGIDDTGGDYQNVIVVAKSGGHYTSVAQALNSVTDAGPNNRYLVWVAPGVYTETLLSQVQGYVHLKGAGPNASIVTSSRTNSTPSPDAATAQLDNDGRISDVSLINQGTGTYGIALYSFDATRESLVDNVVAEANGEGGTGHYGVYLNDAEPTIRDSYLKATGAVGFGTAVNAALGSVNASGGFPQALILNSALIGGDSNGITCTDPTGTGFGLQLSESSPDVRHSYVCGGHRGISVYVNGNVQVRHSHLEVSATSSAFLFETTSSANVSVANSGVFYLSGKKFTGTGNLQCVHAYKSNYTPATDGTTPATACD